MTNTNLDQGSQTGRSYYKIGDNGTGEAIYNKVLKLSNVKEKNEQENL